MHIVFVDVETSGLDPRRYEITQIAAAAVSDWVVVDAFECKLRFDIEKADSRALEINHYDSVVWAGKAISPSMAKFSFDCFLRKYADKEHVRGWDCRIGAHNAPFDMSFVKQLYKQNPYYHSDGSLLGLDAVIEIDTLKLARQYFKDKKVGPLSYKLGDLCDFFEIKYDKRHEAMADVLATVKLAKVLTEAKK